MVNIERSLENDQCRYVLRPNRSLSWRGTVVFFLSLFVISTLTATGLTLLGFWLVLPFAGLEMLALWAGLYVVCRRTYQFEVISISSNTVRIEKGSRFPEQVFTLGRVWARVVLKRCPRAWYPSQLFIRCHGQAVEIGRFLEEEQRQSLASELTRRLRPGFQET